MPKPERKKHGYVMSKKGTIPIEIVPHRSYSEILKSKFTVGTDDLCKR